MRASAPRPAGGNNFPRSPLFCLLQMPRGRRVKGGPCSAFSASAIPGFAPPPLPSTLRHHSPHPVPSSPRRMGARARRLRSHVPNGCPSPRLLRSPSPRFLPFPLFTRSSVARAPLLPLFHNRGALRPTFPQAPSALPASSLPPSLRSLSPERPHSPPRRRSLLTPRAPFATRSPHALIPAFSGAPHRARPPLPQFSPSLPLSLPRRYFFSALFTNVEFLIDL